MLITSKKKQNNKWVLNKWRKRALALIQRVQGFRKVRVSWCQIKRETQHVVNRFQVPWLPSRSPTHCIGNNKQEIPANANVIYTGNSGYRRIPQLWQGWTSEVGFLECSMYLSFRAEIIFCLLNWQNQGYDSTVPICEQRTCWSPYCSRRWKPLQILILWSP